MRGKGLDSTERTTVKYGNQEEHEMGSMKGLAAILGVAVLMVVVAACGSNELDTGEGPTEIGQALEAAEGSEVTVSGYLVVDRDGNTRLCFGLLESSPPQCGGDRIDLLGFDASSVPNSKTPQSPSEIQTARWTDSYNTVTGVKGVGGLAEVRLSTEAPTAQQEPSAPAVGSPPIISGGAPLVGFIFEGVKYSHSGYHEVAPGESTAFVIGGIDVNVDDLAVVGTTFGRCAGCLKDGLQVYRLRIGDANAVYTFTPGQKTVNPEDGLILTFAASWTRCTPRESSRDSAAASTPIQLAEPVSPVTSPSVEEVTRVESSVVNTVAPPARAAEPVPAVMGMMAPDLRLTVLGVEYTGVEILGAASTNGPIVCCGTPINMDDMEVVGTGIQHNPDSDATVQVYRPKADGTTDMYTFHGSQTFSKVEGAPPEDETDTTPATWTRWAAK